MARPATFSGEAEDCSGFLLQVSLYFSMQEQLFSNDSARVAFIISLLSGQALQWAQSLWNSNSEVVQTLSGFVQHFKEVFGQAAADLSVHDHLPGATLPKGRIYPLSIPEQKAMGGVCGGDLATTVHPHFDLPCRFKLLLCG